MIELNEGQQKAFDEIVNFADDKFTNRQCHVLSGAAGVGKSTLTSVILEHLENKGISFAITASTHKAVAVINNLCDSSAKTIHALLGIKLDNCYETGGKKYVQRTIPKLNYDLIVIDEFSMIEKKLLDIIIKTCSKNKNKILFVGDSYQLPPIGSEHDSIPVMDQQFKTSVLTEVMRTALDNPILALATKVRLVLDGGTFPVIKTEAIDNKGVFVLNDKQYTDAIIHFFDKDCVDEIKCIAYTNHSVRNYSKLVRKNRLGTISDVPMTGEVFVTNETISKNKKVIIPNSQEVEILSTRDHTESNIKGLLVDVIYLKNGTQHQLFTPNDLVFVKKTKDALYNKANRMKKGIERNRAWYSFFKFQDSMHDIRPNYAVTSHKAQGSTFDTVFIDLDDMSRHKDPKVVARLLYVALTRARFQVIIFGSLTDKLMNYTQ